jgi:very-short-patch-repair endonuclease
MRFRGVSETVQIAAWRLRDEMTEAEEALWELLRGRRLDGFKFRRQQPIGRFVLDFYCAQYKLAIEADGLVHDVLRERDQERSAVLAEGGIQVLRLTNDDILANPSADIDKIRSRLLSLAPPPAGDGGLR